MTLRHNEKGLKWHERYRLRSGIPAEFLTSDENRAVAEALVERYKKTWPEVARIMEREINDD